MDSTPDDDPSNDPGGNPDSLTDDGTGGDGSGDPEDPADDMDPMKDEDDHDPVILEICDLAVTNVLSEDVNPKVGDTVKFVVNLYNQGNQPATDVTIGYEIPEGFTYLPVNDGSTPSWTSVNDSLATIILSATDTLKAGEEDSVCIYLLLEM